jgi:nucleotide-binding universal stress UspA family protein
MMPTNRPSPSTTDNADSWCLTACHAATSQLLEVFMYRRILVPTDLTDRTIAALEVAANVAAPADARITLLHVIETIAGGEDRQLTAFYRKLERQAAGRLEAIVSRASGTRREIRTEIVYGKRVDEVLRFVHANDVDLVVLASHPMDASKPYEGLGTMSYKLGILAPCAVLLVK